MNLNMQSVHKPTNVSYIPAIDMVNINKPSNIKPAGVLAGGHVHSVNYLPPSQLAALPVA